MFGNNLVSLTHPDEVFYTQSAKEMIAHHSWLTPYIFDRPQFEKPILFYWLLVIAIKFFGLTAFAARFWPAFFGIIGVLVTYWFSFMLFRNKSLSFLSGFILASSVIYVALSRAVLTDMVFSMWVVFSLAFFYFGYSNPRAKRIGIILCFFFSGLAVLTKGMLGIVFPFGTIILFLYYNHNLNFLKDRSLFWAAGLLALIVIPWHYVMIKMYGSEFINEYWFNVHLRRIIEAEHKKSNTWYFYIVTVVAGTFPWSLWLVPAAIFVFKKSGRQLINRAKSESVSSREENKSQLVFLLVWILVVFLVMQTAQSKLASYIFPLFPAVAIILGYYFHHEFSFSKQPPSRAMSIIPICMAGFLLISSVLSVVFSQIYAKLINHDFRVYTLSLLILFLACWIFVLSRRQDYFKLLFANGAVTLFILITAFVGHSYAEPWVSCKMISEMLKKIDQSDSALLVNKSFARGVRFYTDRMPAVVDLNGEQFFSPHPVIFLNSEEKIVRFLEKQPMTYCIVKKSTKNDLDRIGGKINLNITDLAQMGEKYLLCIKNKSPSAQNYSLK